MKGVLLPFFISISPALRELNGKRQRRAGQLDFSGWLSANWKSMADQRPITD
jgi:hypothetical protein